MPKKPTTDDRGFRSPPWRVDGAVVDRVARLAEQLPMSASEIARQALGIGLDEIEKIVGETTSGLGAVAKLGARSRGAGRKR